jgi:hypothetical protein
MGLNLSLDAADFGLFLGLDLLCFRLGAWFNECRLAQSFGGENPVHNLLEIARKQKIVDVSAQKKPLSIRSLAYRSRPTRLISAGGHRDVNFSPIRPVGTGNTSCPG